MQRPPQQRPPQQKPPQQKPQRPESSPSPTRAQGWQHTGGKQGGLSQGSRRSPPPIPVQGSGWQHSGNRQRSPSQSGNGNPSPTSVKRQGWQHFANGQRTPTQGNPPSPPPVQHSGEQQAGTEQTQQNPIIRSIKSIGNYLFKLVTEDIPKDLKNASQYEADFEILRKLNGPLGQQDGETEDNFPITLESTINTLKDGKQSLQKLSDKYSDLKGILESHIDNIIDQLDKLNVSESRIPQQILGALMAVALIPIVSIYAFDQGKRLVGKEPSFRGPTIMGMIAKAPLSAARLWSASNSPASRMDTLWNVIRDRHLFDIIKAGVFGTLNLMNMEPQGYDAETGEGSDFNVLALAGSMAAVLMGTLLFTQLRDETGQALNALFRGSRRPVANQAAENLRLDKEGLSQQEQEEIRNDRQVLQDALEMLESVTVLMTSLMSRAGVTDDEKSNASKVIKGRISTATSEARKAAQEINTALANEQKQSADNEDLQVKLAYLSIGITLLMANASVQVWSDLTSAPGELANALVTSLILGKDVSDPDVDQTAMSETLANWVGYQSLSLIANSVNSGQEIKQPGSGFLRDAEAASGAGIVLGIVGSSVTRKGAELLDKVLSYVRQHLPEATPQEALEYLANAGSQVGRSAIANKVREFGRLVAIQMMQRPVEPDPSPA